MAAAKQFSLIYTSSSTAKMADPSSLSNAHLFKVSSFEWDVRVDFSRKIISGSVTFNIVGGESGGDVVLDTSYLDIAGVKVNGASTPFAVGERQGALGSPLTVRAGDASKGAFTLSIEYATTRDCTAVHWLDPPQTEGKVHPYLFTQAQAIHARSLFPCFDTPSVKAPFTATVRVPAGLVAVMGARSSECQQVDGEQLCRFAQPVGVPVRNFVHF